MISGNTPETLLKRQLAFLDRLLDRGRFPAAHKAVFVRKEIKRCGKILFGQTVSHDFERTKGLSELRRPETAGELMQFLQAINWMRTSLLELAEVEAPLRGLLEECLCNTQRTKRLAARRVIGRREWTDERAAAWDAVRLHVSEAVPLNCLKPGFSVMMFPDASDKFWGICITVVPTGELTGSVAIADMSHEPLGFLSGPFRGSQERWATMEKEGFAIVSTFKRLPYLLWGGVAIHCDNRNLAYMFSGNKAPTSKAVAQRLQGYRVFLGQFPYSIVHIGGDDNCWGGPLSRWLTRPGGPVCVHASVKYAKVLFVARRAGGRCGGRAHPRYVALLDSEGLY